MNLKIHIPNIPFRNPYNWGYDSFKNKDILPFILSKLESDENS